jgi:hypothetical protein
MLSIAILVQGQELTLGRVLADIPHDGPAVLVYVLLAVSGYLIWRGSRRKSRT